MMRRGLWVMAVGSTAMSCASDYGLTDKVEEPLIEERAMPNARCDVVPNPVAPPFETADWLGSESEDPEGDAIAEWNWELVSAPAGSSASMPDGDADRFEFAPDLVGQYEAILTVVDESGDQSEPCTVVLEAVAAENLRVEMFWAIPNDDMDLHLIRDGGAFGLGGDCHWQNCGLGMRRNWGDTNSTLDDPSLDLDDIPGTGPENINIVEPGDRRYYVAVQDYESTRVMAQPNDVTVNVYLSGEKIWTDTRPISGEGKTEWFAEIDWVHGVVKSLDGRPDSL